MSQQPDHPIYLLVGPPAVGKSSAAHALAARFPRSIHIPVDDLRDMVVSGLELPAAEWSDGLAQQVALARDAASHMALRYAAAGFAVVLDDFWDPNSERDYRALLDRPDCHRIVLLPDQAAAHSRNRARAGAGADHAYIDEGIRIVYAQLRDALPQLEREGWRMVDTTALGIADVAAEIVRRTAPGNDPPSGAGG